VCYLLNFSDLPNERLLKKAFPTGLRCDRCYRVFRFSRSGGFSAIRGTRRKTDIWLGSQTRTPDGEASTTPFGNSRPSGNGTASHEDLRAVDTGMVFRERRTVPGVEAELHQRYRAINMSALAPCRRTLRVEVRGWGKLLPLPADLLSSAAGPIGKRGHETFGLGRWNA